MMMMMRVMMMGNGKEKRWEKGSRRNRVRWKGW